MAAIQVKHAENKQLQNKFQQQNKKKKSQEFRGEKMLQSSANQAFVELFSTSTAQS